MARSLTKTAARQWGDPIDHPRHSSNDADNLTATHEYLKEPSSRIALSASIELHCTIESFQPSDMVARSCYLPRHVSADGQAATRNESALAHGDRSGCGGCTMKKPWSPGMEVSPAEAAAHASRLITSMSAASAEFATLWAEHLEEMEGEVLLFSLFGDLARVLMALDLRGSYARNEFEAIASCLEQELAHVSVRDDSDPWKDYIGTVLVTGLFEAFGDEPGVLDRLATGATPLLRSEVENWRSVLSGLRE